ncbi:MAG: T9SS C-terminal target domain-containing protein [Candidatus Omnitrophica bacterium]|nr:T9SS C-terminal target domain-containing protein [Candidatus Omnitrophota bacterium]
MKPELFLSLSLGAMATTTGLSQSDSPPPVLWQATFGGGFRDELRCLRQTSDRGFVLAGLSGSGKSGNKTSPHFGSFEVTDFWVVRLDANGTALWDKSFGGNNWDDLYALQLTADEGYVLGGSSFSVEDGNKSSPNFGLADFWVVRLDADGNPLWDKSYGGNGMDVLTGLTITPDGGYVLGGYSASYTNGNKTSPIWGTNDFWVVRLDSNGDLVWDKSFGGDDDDTLTCLEATSDGGYILGGYSYSNANGNKTSPNRGMDDYWVVRLDAGGNKLWENTFGGSQQDYPYSIHQTADGGFIAGGWSKSGPGGNKSSPNFGQGDFWIIRLDRFGNLLWDRSFGGSDWDYLTSLAETVDGGFVLGGWSASKADGNKTSPNFGGYDFWLVRLDADGRLLWDQSWGGAGSDQVYCLQPTADGGFILGGYSGSLPDSNKTSPSYGGGDFWVVKLAAEPGFPWSLAPWLELGTTCGADLGRDGFRFFFAGNSNSYYRTEYSLNLKDWVPLQTNTVAGTTVDVIDAGAGSDGARFYRVRVGR